MATTDDERPGTRNGRRAPKRRRGRALSEDDRPRGFQPQRMRALWDDIDEARDRLGLVGGDVETAPAWSVGALIGRVYDAAAEASTWLADVTRLVTARVPTPCGVAAWLADVPIVGRLVAFLPGVPARSE